MREYEGNVAHVPEAVEEYYSLLASDWLYQSESEFTLLFSVFFLLLREPEGVWHNGEDTSLTKCEVTGIVLASVLTQ